MKTNRIHSIHQKVKRCWFCNSKLKYDRYSEKRCGAITTNCEKCINNNFFYIDINNNIEFEVHISFKNSLDDDYHIKIIRVKNNFIIKVYNISSNEQYKRNIIYYLNNISLKELRKINIKDYFKLIKSYHLNKVFL